MRLPWPFRRKPEERYSFGSDGWAVGGYLGTGGMGAVPAHMAESLSAVVACVSLISDSLASLPASLLVDTEAGQQPAPQTSPAWRVLQRPNAYQSWPAWMAWNAASILLRGNSLSKIEVDARGAVSGLVPVNWSWCLPSVIGSVGGSPRLAYDIVQRSPESDALGLSGRLLDVDVLHVRARSDAGLIGRSVLSRAAAPVREGLEISQLATSTWRNGMRPSGVVTAPAYLTPEQRKQKDNWIADYSSAINAGRIPLLEGGWKFEAMALSSVDQEFLASRRFSVEDVCRLFNVPAPLIQLPERSVPADLSQYSTLLVQQCLRPMCELIEDEFDHAILPPGMHLELDTDGLERGSFSATVSALAALKQSGCLSANDVRQALGWSPVPGGDALQQSGAPNWPADAAGLPSLSPKPGPTGDGNLPMPGTHKGQGRGNGAAHA
jgi:HK97 family phage portal protein